jgi:hypothetical protein
MLKVLIHGEDIAIINVCAPNNKAEKYAIQNCDQKNNLNTF